MRAPSGLKAVVSASLPSKLDTSLPGVDVEDTDPVPLLPARRDP